MFSFIFPGQGSQFVGMGKDIYDEFTYIKEYFLKANEILNKDLSKIILDGPKDELDLTENTQPAIFLISYSIFKILEKETNFKIKNAKYFAGHSLGEYSALCCANAISFENTLRLLKNRGIAMQNAVPQKDGGMMAVLGVDNLKVNEILIENKNKFTCYIANDNSNGQIVLSGKIQSLDYLGLELKKKNIKFVKLQVSAPFHCPLMSKATQEMKDKILLTEFKDPVPSIISNVTAQPVTKSEDIKRLLIEQIEKPVRWRESVLNMIGDGVNQFIEIGPGKVLIGLIKRIDRKIKLNQVSNSNEANSLLND